MQFENSEVSILLSINWPFRPAIHSTLKTVTKLNFHTDDQNVCNQSRCVHWIAMWWYTFAREQQKNYPNSQKSLYIPRVMYTISLKLRIYFAKMLRALTRSSDLCIKFAFTIYSHCKYTHCTTWLFRLIITTEVIHQTSVCVQFLHKKIRNGKWKWRHSIDRMNRLIGRRMVYIVLFFTHWNEYIRLIAFYDFSRNFCTQLVFISIEFACCYCEWVRHFIICGWLIGCELIALPQKKSIVINSELFER